MVWFFTTLTELSAETNTSERQNYSVQRAYSFQFKSQYYRLALTGDFGQVIELIQASYPNLENGANNNTWD